MVFVAMAPTKSICTTAETGRNGAFGQSQNSLRVSKQPDINSFALVKKLDIPLSTLQRRRANVEMQY